MTTWIEDRLLARTPGQSWTLERLHEALDRCSPASAIRPVTRIVRRPQETGCQFGEPASSSAA
ncbi:hypothetical protein [Streptacidiphilus pinicola]|uniref:hypothetical protein n=1 Tax=Streptacidiphilus pinicola TaxID=2219663 RepID=UPI001057CE5F|nr:hypothetical protein [Streptacidiphilus pinicola]